MTKGISRKGFDLDLKEGQFHESELAKAMGNPSSIELKTDFMAAETGNFFIEYAQKSGPSGLKTTTADYWAFKIPQKQCIILVETTRVRELAVRAYKAFGPKSGGDNNQQTGVLIPIRWIIE